VEHTQERLCPACAAPVFTDLMTVKDHFLSKEDFLLLKCRNCYLVYTYPRPSEDTISDYYKSQEYISHSSTKKGIVNSIYTIVRNYTLNKKVRLVRSLVSGRQLLDIGAGTGHFIKRAQDGGFSVLGLEPDADARQVAKQENNVQLESKEELHSLQTESYDVVTMWHVLEHVYNLTADVKKIVSIIRTNGVLIIAVPNHTSFDAGYYEEFWAAYDVPRHLYHFSPETIKPLIEQFGLKLEKQLPMKFDAYYVAVLSEKYKGGSIMNALRIGFLSNLRAGRNKSSSQIYIFRKK
jgi:2-polyprenyl-3-methyl-5-hydroxy-6-metoxy-1,4-benzoquinol methylase